MVMLCGVPMLSKTWIVRENCGVTVHLVNEGIDTGGIIAQARVTPRREDSFVTYHYLQLAAAIALLSRAIQDALAGTLRTVPPPVGPSRLYSHPTAWEYLVRRATRGIR